MPEKKEFDPLTFIPSSEKLKERVVETERLLDRLRILLFVARHVEATRRDQTENSVSSEKGGDQ